MSRELIKKFKFQNIFCFASFTSVLKSLLSLKGLSSEKQEKWKLELQSKKNKNKFPRTPHEEMLIGL